MTVGGFLSVLGGRIVLVFEEPESGRAPGGGVLRGLADAPVGPESVRVWAELDPAGLSPVERVEYLRLCAAVATAAATRLDAAALAVAEVADPVGLPDGNELAEPGREEVAVALHVTPGSAAYRLRWARELRARAPMLAAALAVGRSGLRHAQVLMQETEGLSDEAARGVAERVHPVLLAGTPPQVTRAVRRAVRALPADPAAEPERPPGAAETERRVVADPVGPDGLAWLHALLPVADAAAVLARLDAAVLAAREAGDPRTADQVRADTLAAFGWAGLPRQGDLLERPGGTGVDLAAPTPVYATTGPVTARVHVTISLAGLLGLRDDAAELATGAPGERGRDLGLVSPEAARQLAANADWQRFVRDESGLLCGVSPAYRIPEPLRRVLVAAYRTCTAYGCPAPAAECDADHCQPWAPDATGGRTCLGNLHPLCRRHHNAKTHGRWHPHRDPDGTITWTSPLGQTTQVRPHDYRPPPEPDPPPEYLEPPF